MPENAVSEPAKDVFQTSFAQQRLWFLEMLEPGTARYNIALAWRLQGSLDVSALERALLEVARRHEILRTTFEPGDDLAVQVVHPAVSWHLQIIQLPEGEAGAQAERQAMRNEASIGFDLANGPLWRASLCRHDPRHHVLLFTLHHIVADGWSVGVLARELGVLYTAFVRGHEPAMLPLPVQYADFAAWQREQLQGERLSQELTHWRDVLAGAPSQLDLPTDRPRPSQPTHRGASHEFDLGPGLSESLRGFCREHRVTPFMALAAALAALLSRWCRQDDLCLGYPVANRQHSQLAGLIGFFVNTLVLRLRPLANQPFLELLRQTRESVLAADAHQDLPFERLVEDINPARSLHSTPLFQVLLAVDQAPHPEFLSLPGIRAEMYAEDPALSKFALSLHVTAHEGAWRGAFVYDADAFEAGTVRALAHAWRHCLENIVKHPTAALRQLTSMQEPDCLSVVHRRSTESEATQLARCVHEHVADRAAERPDAVAVICGDHRLTWRELDQRGNRLAHALREIGVGVESVVGVCVERGKEFVPTLLGVLKAGGAYLPLDPSYPPVRISEMLHVAGCGVVITSSAQTLALPEGVRRIDVDDSALTGLVEAPPETGTRPDHLCYVLFTSGSSGTPKAVAATHRGVVRVTRCADYVEAGPDERVLHAAPLAFDASTFEIWWPLQHGASLVLAPPGVISFDDLAATIEHHRVTTLWLTAALFDQYVRHHLPSLRGVRQLLAGGDALPPAAVRHVIDGLPGCRLINGYGPTETTTFATCHQVTRQDLIRARVAIGRVIACTSAYVLDEFMQPAPDGAVGELYIGGLGLARGYLGDSALTAERFVPNPFGLPGERLYRSGDLMRRLPEGTLDFIRRADTQLKVRGYRVEPAEVEAALLGCPGVHNAVVLAIDDGDGKQLCGVVVPEQAAVIDVSLLRGMLSDRLPVHLVPRRWHVIDALPMTPSGKVDRRALQSMAGGNRHLGDPTLPSSPTHEQPRQAAEGDTERLLQDLWREVVPGSSDFPDPDCSFFDMGGTSLRLLAFHAALSRARSQAIRVTDLFKYPTLRLLARKLDEGTDGHPPPIAAATASIEF